MYTKAKQIHNSMNSQMKALVNKSRVEHFDFCHIQFQFSNYKFIDVFILRPIHIFSDDVNGRLTNKSEIAVTKRNRLIVH